MSIILVIIGGVIGSLVMNWAVERYGNAKAGLGWLVITCAVIVWSVYAAR